MNKTKAKELMVIQQNGMNELRWISNYIVRSNLFSINAETQRDTFQKRTIVCAAKSFMLDYEGRVLGQDDYDVYQLISNLWNEAKEESGQNIVYITKYKLLERLDKQKGGMGYENLDRSLERLSRCTFKVVCSDYIFRGSLVNIIEHTSTGSLKLSFNEELMKMLSLDYKSYQSPEVRKKLKGNLAKWLYNFYSSQSKEQYQSLATLKEWCGSTAITKEFKRQISKALEQLKEQGLIESYKLTRNKWQPLEETQVDVVPSGKLSGSGHPEVYLPTLTTTVKKQKIIVNGKALPEKRGTGRGRVAL